MRLLLNSDSRIDINPNIDEAQRLRNLAQDLKRKEHVNPDFPEIDTAAFEAALVRPLFTLADVDNFMRSNPSEILTGYLSVVLTKLNIVKNFKRNMLMSNECCGSGVFANSKSTECNQCERLVSLRISPTIVRHSSIYLLLLNLYIGQVIVSNHS